MTDKPRNILIIKPSALGDIVQALPAAAALKSRCAPGAKPGIADAKISWLVRPEFAPLLDGHPHIDELIMFDRKLLGRAWHSPSALGALIALIRRLREGRFDAVFDFQGLFRTAALGWLSGCKKRFGMAGARELAHLFYTDKISQDRQSIHLVDYYLKIAEAGGAKPGGEPEFALAVDAKADESVGAILAEHSIERGNYVVLVAGAARANKRWPIERFAELAAKVHSEFAVPVVAVGSATEADYIEGLKAGANGGVVNLAGQTTIAELVALLKSARLVVSNDTGPGHIAAALGVAVVMIFGPTNPARVAPYGKKGSVVAIDPNGRGLKPDSYDPKHNIRNITVEAVFEKVSLQLRADRAEC